MSDEHAIHQGAAMPDSAALLQRIDALTSAVSQLAKIHGARLTRAEVCERIGIHRNTLKTYMASRGFPAPGRDGKWLLAEVIEWEAGR